MNAETSTPSKKAYTLFPGRKHSPVNSIFLDLANGIICVDIARSFVVTISSTSVLVTPDLSELVVVVSIEFETVVSVY